MIEGLWQCCCVQIVCNMSVAYSSHRTTSVCVLTNSFRRRSPHLKKKEKKLFEWPDCLQRKVTARSNFLLPAHCALNPISSILSLYLCVLLNWGLSIELISH